jgi:outer membrane protein
MSQSETAPPPGQMGKIVWLNIDTVLFSCDECKNEFGEIQKFVDGKNAELSDLRKEYDSLKNQMSVQGSKLTDEARADLDYQITTKETELQRFSQDTQKEITNKRDRVTNIILKNLQVVVDKFARDRGLSAVLAINPQTDIWIDPALDFTDEIVKAYNAKYPAAPAKKSLTP